MRRIAFTQKFTGLARQLMTDATILQASAVTNGSEIVLHKSNKALWDTGATGTVINSNLANRLGLKPINIVMVSGVSGTSQQNVYVIDIVLPNNLKIQNVQVTSGQMGDSIDLLIGMNIIALGDFAVSQSSGKTTFSFCYPAAASPIDFVEEINKEEKNKLYPKRNSPYGRNYFSCKKTK